MLKNEYSSIEQAARQLTFMRVSLFALSPVKILQALWSVAEGFASTSLINDLAK
jgi:hypothetical protein